MSETNLPKSGQEHSKPLPVNPTEMLRFQCEQLQYQSQLLIGIQGELQKQRKILNEHMKALNKHTNYLRNVSTAAVRTALVMINVHVTWRALLASLKQ